MEENQPNSTPEPAKKERKGCPLALVITLAVLAIGGIGFGIFELINSSQECKTSVEKESQNKQESDITTNQQDIIINPEEKITIKEILISSEEEKPVKEILENLKQTIYEKGNGFAEITSTYDSDTSNPLYKIDGTETYTPFIKSYGIKYKLSDGENVYGEKGDSKKVATEIVEKLIANNYKEEKSGGLVLQYINSQSGITCEVRLYEDNEVESEINCSYKTWTQTAENEKLIKGLIAAYNKKHETNLDIIYPGEIIKSDYEQYEITSAGIPFAYEEFYRENPESEWINAFGGQEAPACSYFDDLTTKIFKGKITCHDEDGARIL